MNSHYWPLYFEHFTEADWVVGHLMQVCRAWRDEGQRLIMQNRRAIDELSTYRERLEYCAEHECLANVRHVFLDMDARYRDKCQYGFCTALLVHGFIHACHVGAIPLLRYVYTRGARGQEVLQEGMRVACVARQLETIAYLNEYADYNPNTMLVAAVEGGHLDLVRRFVHEGATAYTDAIIEACKRGHEECLHFLKPFVGHGVTPFAYVAAIQCGHHEMLGDVFEALDVDHILKAAAFGGVWSLIYEAERRGASDWDEALAGAVLGDQQEVVDYVLARRGTHDLDDAFSRVHSVDMYTHFIERGYSPSQGLIELIFALMCHGPVLEMINHLLPLISNPIILATGWMDLLNTPYIEECDHVFEKWLMITEE